MTKPTAKVYLVGAGPGDPGLLTIRGRELLQRADVVVYDSLVNETLLRFAPNAEHVFVGKRPGQHALAQEDVNRLLVDHARRVQCVVRLKGGDPCVFGRGGEEAETLARAGVPFEIVPGVSAGIGVPAYAGIPVTHRGKASSVTFLTGHRDPETGEERVAIDRIHLEGTLVVFMGVKHLGANVETLIRLGRPATTPAAAIEWGTYARQRTIVATLADIHERCTREGIEAPVILVVGEVVALRDVLSWFEHRPLFGRRVVVTRARDRSADLVNRLRELGADVLEFPTIEVATTDAAQVPDLAGFDWIVLMSVNAVDTLAEHMAAQALDARSLHGTKLCAISAKTKEALTERFLSVDAFPDQYEPERVLGALEAAGGSLQGTRMLLPRADIGRSALPKLLRERGAEVVELQAYHTEPPPGSAARADAVAQFRPDYVVFGSGAAARNFERIMGAARLRALKPPPAYAAIGPVAARGAAEVGLEVAIIPDRHRIPDLVDALVEYETKEGERKEAADG